MTKAARQAHASPVLQPGSAVSWWVGPKDKPDMLRTGKVIRRDPHDDAFVWVRADQEMGERRMALADLDGPWRARSSAAPVAVQLVPRRQGREAILDLPTPHAQSLDLLELLDQGVEIQAGQQRTVLGPMLHKLQEQEFIEARGDGRWELTARGREVIDG